MRKSLGRNPKELDALMPKPTELGYLYDWFYEVASGEALTYQEMHHWSLVSLKEIRAWEADILMSLHRILRKVRASA